MWFTQLLAVSLKFELKLYPTDTKGFELLSNSNYKIQKFEQEAHTQGKIPHLEKAFKENIGILEYYEQNKTSERQ